MVSLQNLGGVDGIINKVQSDANVSIVFPNTPSQHLTFLCLYSPVSWAIRPTFVVVRPSKK